MLDTRLAQDDGSKLKNHHPVSVLKLGLLPGKWLVWGRVFLANDDGDRQKASVELRLMNGPQIDLWVAFLSEEEFVTNCITLQGAIDVPGKDDKPIAIEMLCSTFDGSARFARLMAHPVTGFGDHKIP